MTRYKCEFKESHVPTCGQFLYRFEDCTEGRVFTLDREPDSLRRIDSTYGTIRMIKCIIMKETPKGWWVVREDETHTDYNWRWVAMGKGKRYAYPNLEDAWESYGKRKRKHCAILERQLKLVKDRLKAYEAGMPEECYAAESKELELPEED